MSVEAFAWHMLSAGVSGFRTHDSVFVSQYVFAIIVEAATQAINRSIGYGYVRRPEGVTADFVRSGSYELEVGGDRIAAEVSLQPFYDPTNARVKS